MEGGCAGFAIGSGIFQFTSSSVPAAASAAGAPNGAERESCSSEIPSAQGGGASPIAPWRWRECASNIRNWNGVTIGIALHFRGIPSSFGIRLVSPS